MLEKKIFLSNLFDCYGELLTKKQKNYFKDYYFENLSLSEMSDIYHVTRNAIYNALNNTEKKLVYYENKLNLLQKKAKLQKVIVILDDGIKNQIINLI